MDECKPIKNPVKCRNKLLQYDEGEPTIFKSLVGSLHYLTCIWQDILLELV